MSISEINNDVGVAIIGMSGRFPGAADPDQFWENIKNGIASLSHFTDEELLENNIAPELLAHPDFIKAGYILDDVDQFDAEFFHISNSEAELMDPQQRLFLEAAWQAMENSGYVPGQGEDIVGVFASAAFSTYFLNLLNDFTLAKPTKTLSVLLGNDKDYLASRVNYKLNLKGPAITAQCACSSSLVGICMACQSLLEYQIDMAIAGGVSVDIPSKHGFLHQATEGAISRDCTCRSFDAEASGVAMGNGVGVLILKRLQDAIEDKDTIHAVIRGFATNNDGSDKVGFTAPSVRGQQKVIAEAIAMADIEPETIGYVETHGTGTVMGDPIEVQALNKGFGSGLPKQSCAIGSVKTNVGHLNAAAGVASVIKTIYSLKEGLLAPSLHFKTPNPAIDFAGGPFYVNTSLKDWKTTGAPRRAGVSSFGLGGNNAHIILEEPPAQESAVPKVGWHILPFSARTESALAENASHFSQYLANEPETDLFDIAYTLQNGRTAFPNRKVVLCTDRNDLQRVLATDDAKRSIFSRFAVKDTEKDVAFMFPGAGTQYQGMGAELYEAERVFRETVDHCAKILFPIMGADIRSILYPGQKVTQEERDAFLLPTQSMPAIFVTEYALAKLWQSRGIVPRAMMGHSLGEYVAATVAGVLSLEDALTLVTYRAELISSVPEGGMLVALASEEQLQEYLGQNLSIGAINGPSLCMVSGPIDDMETLQKQLKENKIGFRSLPSGRAGHGSMMDPILGAFRDKVSQITFNPPTIPLISNVTGDWLKDEEATDPEYWVRHMRNPVRFSQGVERLLASPDHLLLEVGPGQGLKTLTVRHPAHTDAHHVFPSMRDVRQTDSDLLVFNKALASLWLAGLDIDWVKATGTKKQGKRIPLPTYPFERQRYFIESKTQQTRPELEQAAAKRPNIGDWFYVPSWKRSLSHEAWRGKAELSDTQTWLVFMDPHGLGNSLVELLGKAKQDVVTVHAGNEFSVDNKSFIINPGRQDDYDSLFQHLQEKENIPHRIVHLWNITPDDRIDGGIDAYEILQDYGFNSLIFLMRGITASKLHTHEMQLGVVTTNIHNVTGTERICPEKSPLLGPCKVIPNEFPSFRCKNIDIELDTEEEMVSLAAMLLGEITCTHASFMNEKTVAYRGRQRWIQEFESVPLDKDAGEHPPLRENGVYLITGGLGGVGYVLGEHMARTCHPRLALIGRTQLPKRDAWEQWLKEHDDEEHISVSIRKAMHLEELGAEILPLSADVGDLAQMKDVAARVSTHFGELDGIIHAAGVEGGGMIELRDLADTDSNANAKIRGTLVMEKLFQDASLDFFMLCSSLVSFIGSVGGVDYASANIFMDSFANARERGGKLHAMAVNWDYWANIGMGKAIIQRHQSFAGTLEKLTGKNMAEAISPEEGAEAFNRLLSTTFPQLIVSTRDLPTLLKSLQKTTGAMREVFDQANFGGSTHPRPKLATPFVEPRDNTEQGILEIWTQILGIDGLGVDDPYFELGGDSLHAMPLIAKLREEFKIDIPLRIVYSHDTVAKMAEFVVENSPTDRAAPLTGSQCVQGTAQ